MTGPITIKIVESLDGLREWVPAWTALAAHASSANVFFEPDFVFAALSHLEADDVRHLFVCDEAKTGHERLIGYVPLKLRQRRQLVTPPHLETWRYSHCYSGMPLIRGDCEHAFFEAVLEMGPSLNASGAFLRFNDIDVTTAAGRALLGVSRGRARHLIRAYHRPFIDHTLSFDQHQQQFMGKATRKSVRRKMAALKRLGDVSFATLDPSEKFDAWFENYARIEALGWKGGQGSALGQSDGDRAFFETVLALLHEEQRLIFRSLSVDGKVVASLFDVLARDGTLFALKTAYDPSFKQASPGMLLEHENVRRTLDAPQHGPMDSCLMGENSAVNQIWKTSHRFLEFAIAHPSSRSQAETALSFKLRSFKKSVSKNSAARRGKGG